MFDVQCAECGVQTQVPFKPNGSRPVKCRDCFQGDRPRGGDRGGHRGGDRGGDREWKKSFDVTCDKCGKETSVPFKPSGDREVLCRPCFSGDETWQDEFDVECDECGVETKVKFKPTGKKPILCNECFGNSRPQRQDREMFDVDCDECGVATSVPFKPTGDRPVKCRDCFQASRPPRENNFRGGDRGGHRGGDRGGERRETFDVTCAECGIQTTVPFKPTGSRPVKCRDCFRR
ncbi:MAG: CxxC-x17-CxxC domain-containing protein [Thermoplasmatota archaeon]